MTKPIDTGEIRGSIPNRCIQDDEILALCDEIDRLRGEQSKVTALEAIRDAAVSVSLTWYSLGVDGETYSVVDYDKITALSNAILRENDHYGGEKQTPQGKTVRVKAAVAVDPNSNWCAYGRSSKSKAGSLADANCALMGMSPFSRVYKLIADLPVPEEVTVKAEVENGNG